MYSSAMAQSANNVADRLGDKSSAVGIDESSRGFIELEEDALNEAVDQLADNRKEAERMGRDPEQTVGDVLSEDNVRDVEFYNRDWQDPKVTIWLRECPTWANWAGNKKLIRIDGRRDLHYVLDVRKF